MFFHYICQFLHNNKAASIKKLLSNALKEKHSFVTTFAELWDTINDLRSTFILLKECILSSQQLLMQSENVI